MNLSHFSTIWLKFTTAAVYIASRVGLLSSVLQTLVWTSIFIFGELKTGMCFIQKYWKEMKMIEFELSNRGLQVAWLGHVCVHFWCEIFRGDCRLLSVEATRALWGIHQYWYNLTLIHLLNGRYLLLSEELKVQCHEVENFLTARLRLFLITFVI